MRQSIQNYLYQILVIGSFLENGFEDTLSSKRNVLSFWNTIFPFFGNFWVTNLKPFSGKVRQSDQNYLNQNLVIGSFLKIVLQLPWTQKRTFLAFKKTIFLIFAKFWVTKLKRFSGKVRQSVQNYLTQNLVIGNFLKNDSEATFS